MSPTGTSTATQTRTTGQELTTREGNSDVAESVIRKMDRSVKDATGVSLFHMLTIGCLLYTSPSPRDGLLSRMPSSA